MASTPTLVLTDIAGVIAQLRRLHLHQLITDPETTGGQAVLAGLARRMLIDQPFIAGPASGQVTPTFTARIPAAGQREVGLLLEVVVRLSVARLANLIISTDLGEQVLVEEPAVGGSKKPWHLWLPFKAPPTITIANPSASFYVAGQVYAPVIYLREGLYEAIRAELAHDFNDLIRAHGL